MPLTLGKKIFLTFFTLLVLALSLSFVIIRGSRDLQVAANRIATVKDFQLLLARLNSRALVITNKANEGDAAAFEAELEEFLFLADSISSFDLPYHENLRSDVANLSALGENYRQAYDELFRRNSEDKAFLTTAAGMHRKLAELAGSVSPGDRAAYFERLNRYFFLQDEIYHSRDGRGIARLKEAASSIAAIASGEDINRLMKHLTATIEKNYLNSLAIAGRQEFLADSRSTFTKLSENIIHIITTDSLAQQKRSARMAWVLITVFATCTFAALIAFTRYTRHVTDSFSTAISSIRDERYDYEIPYAPRDEFGELMAFLKDMSLTLGKSLESTRDSEKFLQEIIDGIAEPIMLIDLDYRVLLMNRTARQTSKLSPGEGAGLNCYQVSHGSEEPCGGEDHLCPLEQVRKTGKKITVQHIHDSLAGKRVIEIVASPLFDSQGGLKGIIEAGRDITKRKRIEEELLKANSELEKRYRELQVVDEVKNNLIRDVSHELKTPVAKHSMQLEILRPLMEKHSLTGEEAKAFSVMEDSIRRQEDVIRNLLDLSRLESGRQRYHIAPLRLDELLERVRSDYLYAVEQCGGSVNCSVSSVVVNSDSDMLWHLFSNLLNNAIKFRKAGRPVRVDITAEVADGAVKVLLTDDGLGLSEQEKKMVFERFYQTTASSEGSGVGLTICRMIAEDLGGKVELRSEGKERGTTAVVTLPLAEDSLSA